jgi:hypothetical protein
LPRAATPISHQLRPGSLLYLHGQYKEEYVQAEPSNLFVDWTQRNGVRVASASEINKENILSHENSTEPFKLLFKDAVT